MIDVRGGTITVTEEAVELHRSALAGSLYPDLHLTQLLGWRGHAPDSCTPGWIQLLVPEATNERILSETEARDNAHVIHFAAGQQENYEEVDALLTNFQAGYSLDQVTEVSEEDWAAEVASPPEEKEEPARKTPWAKVATPDEVPETNTDADVDGPIFGDVVCVTGDVEPYDKGQVWDMIAEHGATVSKNVTKKTTLLVIGEWATMTSKEKRARELQDKGQDIRLWSFEEFLQKVVNRKD